MGVAERRRVAGREPRGPVSRKSGTARGVDSRALPRGYVRYAPNGSTIVVPTKYIGFHVGGVYYRPVFDGGESVYVPAS